MTTRRDLARTTFAVLFIGVLLAASLWILRPFLGPTIWAMMVVVATWPMMLRVQARLWGRRSLAVALMSLLLLLLFVVPLSVAIVTIVGNADRMMDWARLATTYRLPDAPPPWLQQLPLVGGMIEKAWQQASDLGLRDLAPKLSPYAGDLTRWFVAEVGSVGVLLLQFLMTVVIAAVMYGIGEEAATVVRRFARRLSGERGVEAVELAGGAIRGVALGVGITALVQAVLGGPGAGAGGCAFCRAADGGDVHAVHRAGGAGAGAAGRGRVGLCQRQHGLGPVSRRLGPGGGHDGQLPAPGAHQDGRRLPLLLIFAGVIGGMFAFGLVGIFVGPVVLAVAWRLLEAWMDDGDAPPARGVDFRD